MRTIPLRTKSKLSVVHTGKLKIGMIMLTCLLQACAPAKGHVGAKYLQETINEDMQNVYKGDISDVLTLEEALARGIKYNLDTKVAEYNERLAGDELSLERMNALPSITAKREFITRNNDGASSSLSVLSGVQSLEPSISTDRHRLTALLEGNWNLLDASLSIARTHSASDKVAIAAERRRKVFHNVVQDIYSAYWRSVAAQETRPKIDALLGDLKIEKDKIDQAMKSEAIGFGEAQAMKDNLIARQDQLQAIREGLILAEIELKALIAMPPSTPIVLDTGGRDWLAPKNLPEVKLSIDDMETLALLSRPEVREEVLNKRISARNIKFAFLETLPGLNLLAGANHDENRFLVDERWLSLTATLTASLTKILTLPARHRKAENEQKLAEQRRLALLAAVMTQVHVAKARLDFVSEQYDMVREVEEHKKKILHRALSFEQVGLMGGAELMAARIDHEVAGLNKVMSYVSAQEAFGQFLGTMGFDIWAQAKDDMNVEELAVVVKDGLSVFDKRSLDSLPGMPKGKDGA